MHLRTMDPRLVAFERLLNIMDDLRAKCPWDMKQTMETLRPLTIEETYELGDAILENDLDGVKKELGDILLHIVFYAKIGKEKNAFDIADVCNAICDKLIHRHPHIYGDVKVKDEEEVKANWEKIKLAEKAKAGATEKSVLEGVPRGLPSLVKAIRIQGLYNSSNGGFHVEEGNLTGSISSIRRSRFEPSLPDVHAGPAADQ